jgi:hypothetical protein
MMVLAAFGMLVFGTLDVAFGLRRNLDAFVFQFAKGVRPVDEFAEISDWVNVMKFADYAVQTFIGDGILVSRVSYSLLSGGGFFHPCSMRDSSRCRENTAHDFMARLM